jgi:Secretion system C-terminal sorting domain
MKNFTLTLLFSLCLMAMHAQPVVSLVHNDLNTLDRTIPNLVSNGSFETGGPSTGNQVSYFWTRPCNTNVPVGWTADGDQNSYGFWGYFQSTDAAQYNQALNTPACDNTLQTVFTDAMMDAAGHSNNLLYFGNYEVTINGPAPSYNAATGEYIPRAQVAAAEAAIGWTNYGSGAIIKPIKLSQTVTGLTAGNYYELEFWVTAEFFGGTGGIFQLNVGSKKFWLITPGPENLNGFGNSERYHLVFQATAASTVLTFTNFGHFNSGLNPAMAPWFAGSASNFTSEIAVDDVIINQRTINVSGKIFIDVNGDGNSGGDANYTAANHYVNLVGPDGKILYSALVDATGNYSFPAPMNTAGLSIQISKTSAALEANPNAAEAPTGYTNTTPVSIPLTTVAANIINQDFGVQFMVLPISFGEFNAVNKDDNSILSWVTYSEQDASHFEIEKSIDGFASSKNTVGKVEAAGNSSVKKSYSFAEKNNNSPVNYYRIKMVDKNGSFVYSNIVSVKGNRNIFVQVRSNPFTDKISLIVQATAKYNAIVNITDLSGRKVVTSSARLVQGVNNVEINNLNNLPKGIYILEVSGSTENFKFKLLKK